MSLAPAVLAVLPALIFLALRTAKAVGPTSPGWSTTCAGR